MPSPSTAGYRSEQLFRLKSHADDLHAQLAEIDENLIRADLTALDRGEHLARRKTIYEALNPETVAKVAGARGTHKVLGRGDASADSAPASFTDDTAAKTGAAESTVRESVQIATSIPEAVTTYGGSRIS